MLEDNALTKIGFRDLRHTYATLLLINNYDLKAVSQLLGHASTIITSNVYFDKNKLVIACTSELNDYIGRVKPLEISNEGNILLDDDLDTNDILNRFI